MKTLYFLCVYLVIFSMEAFAADSLHVDDELAKKAAMYYASEKWENVIIFDYSIHYSPVDMEPIVYVFALYTGINKPPSFESIRTNVHMLFEQKTKLLNYQNDQFQKLDLKDIKSQIKKIDKKILNAEQFGTIVISARMISHPFVERRNGLPDYLMEEGYIDKIASEKYNGVVDKKPLYFGPGMIGYQLSHSTQKTIIDYHKNIINNSEFSSFQNKFLPKYKNNNQKKTYLPNKVWEKIKLLNTEFDINKGAHKPSETSNRNVIPNVPFYEQDRYGQNTCGPTSSAQVLGYWDGNGYPNLVDYGSADQDNNVDGVTELVDVLKVEQNWSSSDGVKQWNIGSGIKAVSNNPEYGNNLNFSTNDDFINLWNGTIKPAINATPGQPFVFSINEEFEEPNGTKHTWAHSMTGVGYDERTDMNILILHINDGIWWNQEFEINFETINFYFIYRITKVSPNGNDNTLPNVDLTYPNVGGTFTNDFRVEATANDTEPKNSGIWQVEFQYSDDHSNWFPIKGRNDYGIDNDGSDGWQEIFSPFQLGMTYASNVWVRARSRDNWGNYSFWDESDNSFTVDVRPISPTGISVTASLIPTSTTISQPLNVSGSAIYNTGVAVKNGTVSIDVIGNNSYTAFLDANGNFSKSISAPSLGGNYTVRITVSDGTVSNYIDKSLNVTSGVSNPSTYVFVRSTVCEDVQGSDPYEPINETHWIRSSFTKVNVWVHLQNLYTSVRVKWEWYKPDGTLWNTTQSSWTDDPQANGYSYWSWWKLWSNWTVRGTNLADMDGRWTLKIYVKEFGGSYRYHDSQFFTMRYNFTEHKMAQDAQNSDPYNPINPTNIFYQNNNKALTWMNLDDVSEAVEVKWEFYEPNGSLYRNAFYTANDPGSGSYYSWYRFWGWIDIGGNSSANKSGDWLVNVSIKNASGIWENKYSDHFRILESPNVLPIPVVSTSTPNLEGTPVKLNIDVTDNTYLKQSLLYWDDGSAHNQTWDNLNKPSFSQVVDLGSFAEGKKIKYWTKAIDNSGNVGASAHKQIIIGDNDVNGPSITNLTISEYNGDSNGKIDEGEQVKVMWNLSDQSGIKSTLLIIDDSSKVISGNYYSISGPYKQGSHSLKIFATDNDISPSNSSLISSFSVVVKIPDVPTLSSPANNSTGISTTPTLIWNPVTGADTYNLQIATDANFTAIIKDTSQSDTSYNVTTGLTNSTKHYWRVSSTNTGGTSNYSSVWNFTTIVAASGVPTLSSPANNSTGISTTPTLIWNPVIDADTYNLQIATDANFTAIIIDASLSDTSYNVTTAIINGTKYYWKVNETNAGGTSDYSTVWNFTVKLSTPTLISPNNNETNVSLTPTLTWSAVTGADTYRLEVNTQNDFTGTVVYDNNALTSATKQIGALSDNTPYYWRVTALTTGGNSSDVSSINSFTTTKASLTFPANGATNVSTSPTLTWPAVNGADKYRLEVNTKNDFTGTVVYNNSTLTTNSQALSGLTNNTTYYWRVTASSNAIAKINTSTIYNFTTITATSPQLSVTPTDIDLGSNQTGTNFSKTFTIKNTGVGTLTGNISESVSWITSLSSSSFSLTENQNETITIQGTFPSTSPFSTDVSVTSNGGNQNVNVHGVVTPIGNRPPTWDTGGELTNQTISVGETLNFTYKASDLDGDTLTYAFVGNHPADANLNATTGVFSWTPQTASQYPIVITVSATDGKSPAIQTQAQITIDIATITVSGKVTYENTSNTPIVGAVVKLMSGTTVAGTGTTNATGDYSITGVTGGTSYTISATKTTGWPSNAVLASDALLAARSAVGAVTLSTLQTLAADVTGNGNVSAGDALQILRRVVGQITSFTIADWQFETKTTAVGGSNTTANFKGIAAGDVNESATTLPKKSEVSVLSGKNVKISPNSDFELPVSINAAQAVAAFTLRFTYPVQLMTFKSVKSNVGVISYAKDNKISIAWAQMPGERSLKDGETPTMVFVFKATKAFAKSINAGLTLENGEIVNVIGKNMADASVNISQAEVSIHSTFALSQNYPNPFNPSTKISYTIGTGQLSALSKVVLKIYDVLGREVRTLVNKEQPAGHYSINFNAYGLTSGVYFYRIIAKSVDGKRDFVTTKKLILMK